MSPVKRAADGYPAELRAAMDRTVRAAMSWETARAADAAGEPVSETGPEPRRVAACRARYRSYDPVSHTYVNAAGARVRCRL